MKNRVVVIGSGFTSRLGIIRSVAQLGCDISVIVMTGYKKDGKTLNKKKPIDCFSRYVSNMYFCHVKDKEGLINILLNKCTEKGKRVVVIPDSDFSASTIDDNYNTLKDYFLLPNINDSQGEISKLMNKQVQKELAKSIGLEVAPYKVIEICNKDYSIPKGITYPCFTKPLLSIEGGKQLFRRCDNEKELRNALNFISNKKSDIKVLVENYINIEKEYAVLGFSDGNEIIIPGVIHLSRISKTHPGVALQGEVMPTFGFESIVSLFKEYIKSIGFVGLFDIDFFYCNGHYIFGELNLRFGGSGYAITIMGVNLPAMFVKHLLCLPNKSANKEIMNIGTFANERMCIDDWYKYHLSTKEYHRILNSVDFTFVQDNIDSKPEKILKHEYKNKRVLRFLKRLLKN